MKPTLGFVAVLVALWGASVSAWEEKKKEVSLCAMPLDGGPSQEAIVFEDLGFVGSPDISPDGKKLAADGWKADQKTQDAHVLIVDLETGEVQDLGPGAMPTWSPDGSLISYSSYSGGVWIRSVKGQEQKQVDANGWGIQWSPDGKKLVYTVGRQLMVYDVLAGTKKEVFPQNSSPYQHFYWNCNWSPDSKKVCIKAMKGNDQYELVIVTVDGDKPETKVLGSANEIHEDVSWHPDGTRIFAANHQGRVLVFRPDGSEPPQELKEQPTEKVNGNLTVSKDGKLLLFTSVK